MIVETEAVVLHSMDYGDTSKIVTVYTRKFGKIKIIAKGARSSINKFGSSLEPMTNSSIVIYKKEHKDLHLLSKSEITSTNNRIQENDEKLYTGLALIELTNIVMHDEEENEPVFSMLVDALHAVDRSIKSPSNIFIAFQMKLFHRFGFGLSLGVCSRCERKTNDEEFRHVHLQLSNGKIVCSFCSDVDGISGVKISGGMVKSLLFLDANSFIEASVVTLPVTMRGDILAILQTYLRYHIEGVRTLKSLSMLFNTK